MAASRRTSVRLGARLNSVAEQRPNYQVIVGPNGPQVVDVNNAAPISQTPSMLKSIIQLMRLDRPVGILLLLWPTLCALWLAARGIPNTLILLIFIAGVGLTRSAGCVINDYADRWLDGQVARTKNRPLASGKLSGSVALALFAGLMVLAFLLELLTNRNTVYLSIVALLIATIYPYCKRYTYYPQMVLGVAFSMGIPMAFTALDKTPDAVAWLLFCGNCLWTLAYDTLYAMVDREDDLTAGAKSTAILFGELDIIAVAILHGCALLAFTLMGFRAELHWPFFAALAVVLLLMSWQIRLAMTRQTAAYFQAFRANQWLGLALFAGVWAGL
jgi:4-hydroxybenzoate polyprenyltransferase